MSLHLDSPLARQDVRLDITDVYLFRGKHGTIFVINVNSSIAGEDAPQGFHPEALYEFNIDTDGDTIEDMTYRVSFGERDADGTQSLELRRLDESDARDRSASGILHSRGHTNTELVTDTTVQAIVLEVSDTALQARHIGFWSTTALATDAGGWSQTNRAALPLVPLILNPDDREDAGKYNTTQPVDDRANYASLFSQRVARVVAATGTAEDPEAYGRAVADLCFPDVLPYEVGTQAMYGFARRKEDDHNFRNSAMPL